MKSIYTCAKVKFSILLFSNIEVHFLQEYLYPVLKNLINFLCLDRPWYEPFLVSKMKKQASQIISKNPSMQSV